MEYLEQDFEDIIQTTIEHNASSVNMKNAETEDNDKENAYTDNAAGSSNKNGNDDLFTIIRNKRKRKSYTEEVQSTQSQNLTNIAQKTHTKSKILIMKKSCY